MSEEDDLGDFEEFDTDEEQSPTLANTEPGILTEKQRKFLYDAADVEPGSAHERTVRSRIRERLRNGIWDLALVTRELEDRDIKQVATDENLDLNDIGPAIGLLARIYFLAAGFSADSDEDVEKYTEWLEEATSGAAGGPFVEEGHFVEDVSVDIEIELSDDAMSEIEQYDALPRKKLLQMSIAGEISHEDFINEMMRREEDL